GPGMGTLQVLESPGNVARSWLFEAEVGVNAKLLWNFGLYANYKYLYAYKQPAINFSEHVMLVGITFNFGLLKQ
ncbi:MAG: hypothetical protein MI922_20960, partial [Bacteroidales bacterium]|nr:hypothetical protein [Bacteroidales bacterium]